MRLQIDTPFHSFEADTIEADPSLDLDGEFEVLADNGERLMIHGWLCDIEVVDASIRPAGWYVVEV